MCKLKYSESTPRLPVQYMDMSIVFPGHMTANRILCCKYAII